MLLAVLIAVSFIFICSAVIHTVLEICSAISIIDQALHANTWKFLIRYVFVILIIHYKNEADSIPRNSLIHC